MNHWADAKTPTPSFTLAASPTSVSFTSGGGAALTLNVSVSGGFNSAVALSVSGLPAGITAQFTPTSLSAPGSGAVNVKISSAATAVPGTYNLSISATGAGLSQAVALSVTVQPNCTFSVAPLTVSAPAAGGSFSSSVTTQAGCSWTASTAASWTTFTGGSSGTGSAKVTYSVAANPTTSVRTASITIAGAKVTVTQAAATAVYSFNPSSVNVPASGGKGNVAISASPSGAAWSVSSSAAWITISGPSSGTGSATVGYSVAPNSGAARTGTLSLGATALTVLQSGAACSYQIALGPIARIQQGFSGSVSITTGPACQWTASSSVPWVSITSGASGSGNGTVKYLAAANSGSAQRTGALIVAGYTITFSEAAPSSRSALGVALWRPHRR